MLAQPSKEKDSKAIVDAQIIQWSKENTRPKSHRRPAKKSLVLEVIDHSGEVDEEENPSE